MLDIRFIRDNKAAVEKALVNRNESKNLDDLIALDDKRRNIIIKSDELKAKRNTESKKIGQLIKEGISVDEVKANVRELGNKISDFDEELRKIENDIREQLLYLSLIHI